MTQCIMTQWQLRAITLAIFLASAAPAAVLAQDANGPDQQTFGQEATLQQPAPVSPQLASLLAPVALYPDPLLASILTASTYPLEVVEADRWLADPANAGLSGDALLNALNQKDWDPSVKALVPFPQILKMMDEQLLWTQQLGNAFLADQTNVMDTVQSLRLQAQQAAGLASTPQQTVTTDNEGAVEIQPVNPGQVSVPSYDPNMAYGQWPYPEAPPVVMPSYYDPGSADPSLAGGDAGFYFAPPVILVEPVWFWCRFDWHHHHLDIDRDRVARLDPRHPHAVETVWQHDPMHRHGVAYHDPLVRQRFQPGGAAVPAHPIPTVFTGIPLERHAPAAPQTVAPPVAVAPANAVPRGPVLTNRPPVRPAAVPPPSGARPVTVPPGAAPPRPVQTGPARPGVAGPVGRAAPSFYHAPVVVARPMMPAHFVAPLRSGAAPVQHGGAAPAHGGAAGTGRP